MAPLIRLLSSLAALAVLTALASCDAAPIDAREAQVVSVMAAADEPLIRSRPVLSAGKYTRMASGAYAFYRGTVPVFRSDMRSGTTALALSNFSLDVPMVPSIGDPHPENFGALRASDGTLALEPNDFDSADRAPYLWDVRRLGTGMALAAMTSNVESEPAHEEAVAFRAAIVRSAIMAYRNGIERAAAGLPPRRITESKSALVVDVFRRSERDYRERAELEELTTLANGQRRLKRGVLDPEDLQGVFADLPNVALATLPAAIERWRTSLPTPPPREDLTLVDAVRTFGSGVASWPRVRAILLLRGPTDDPEDDVLVELKEIADAATGPTYGLGIAFDSVGQRVAWSARTVWARPDAEPLWGYTDWLGLPCQIRVESEGQKSINVDRMEDEAGTVASLSALGDDLGAIVARAHTSGENGIEHARAIWKRIAEDPSAFVEEQVVMGIAYADLVVEDHARFVRALRRPGGLRLGIPFDPLDTPPADLAALYGTPPEPPPLPSFP